ncbi:hypothetical protein [Paludisphaera soli]|uniref:hypothetical protein n=1 Tax=Paludisphaera soli TaxID=2712865 RepID=UPI0013ED9812|nr:hypothetical protein [Paludisphaera soli]
MVRPTRGPGVSTSVACLLLGLGLLAGCRGEPEPMRPPGVELAKSSLARVLGAWKAGRRDGGGLIGSSPAVGVVDALQRERPLAEFEIVGALFPMAEARPFAVRLTLDSPREVVTARYVVLGADPIWVFRQEDYDLILHWEHKMTQDEVEGTPPAKEHPGPDTH